MSSPSDVFQIDQNYPTSNFLLVPGPNPQLYTVYIFKYSVWATGNQNPVSSIAQSAVNSDGTWQGVFDPTTQTYSAITLPETEVDGTAVGSYTVVAIRRNFGFRYQPTSTIILALQLVAPSATTYILPVALGGTGTATPSLIAGSNITITGAWPDQRISSTGGGGGGSTFNIVNLNFSSPPYTAIAQDMVLCDTSGGAFAVTLPLSGANSGASIIIQKISSDTNQLTVDPGIGDDINGSSSEIISFENSSMLVIANGVTSWRIS